MHPLVGTLSDLSNEELHKKYNELTTKLNQAYRFGPTSVIPQMQMILENYRLEIDNRNQKLKDCDWAVMQDVVESKGANWYNSWKTYRQALRDLPDTVSFKEDEYPPDFYTSVNWPQEPSVR